MPKRSDRFVLGHRGKGQVVYSRDGRAGECRFVEPMTLTEVKQFQAKVAKINEAFQQKMVIYELNEYSRRRRGR